MSGLAAQMWAKPSGARDWFQKQYVEPLGVTRAKNCVFGDWFKRARSRSLVEFARCWEDHSKGWFSGRTPLVFTTEPYGLSLGDIDELLVTAKAHDLTLEIDARSPHFQGATVMVILTTRDAEEIRRAALIARARTVGVP